MEIGIDSFVALLPDPATGAFPVPSQRMADLLVEMEIADQVGIDIFGVSEHQRKEFLDSATAVILAAGAARTKRLRLTSSVTVLGTADPVRVFQDFATLDLISQGRAEMIVGRGAFREAYPLFGLDAENPDVLFAEKLDLLLKLRESNRLNWRGRYRPALSGQPVFPRPVQPSLPIWLGVGGTPQSFVRAGTLGLPLMVAIIGGSFSAFRPLVDLYREAGLRAGHLPDRLQVGIHAKGFVADSDAAARDAFFPGWSHLINTIGAERGWAKVTRGQFDAQCAPGGAFMIGDPDTVVDRMLAANDALGGLTRITLEMSGASANVPAMRRSIELLGTRAAPAVRARLDQRAPLAA